MSHVQLNVRDVEASKKFYQQYFGGTPVNWGQLEGLKYPGVIFFFAKAEPTGAMEGSSVNHIGFTVKNGVDLFTRMQKAGVKTASNGVNAQGRDLRRLCLQPGRREDRNHRAGDADRSVGIRPGAFLRGRSGTGGGLAWSEVQTWYTKVFGANATRTVLSAPAANNAASAPMSQSTIPTTNLRFSPASASVPTRGRALDQHRVRGQGSGGLLHTAGSQGREALSPVSQTGRRGDAYLTDPKGTYIQLTEGLGKL